MGGTQSAVCYLSSQLAFNGHEVTLLNHISKPGVYAGVTCPGIANQSSQYLNSFDVLVVVNVAAGYALRKMGVTTHLMLWSGHAADQQAILALHNPEEKNSWNNFIFVSKWQAESYARVFGIDPTKILIIGNAMAPSFEAITRQKACFAISGNQDPILAYTSTPFRGLDVLLLAFPTIRLWLPNCQLKVYSGMGMYNTPAEQDKYSALYELCKVLPGVEYIGPVSQTALAEGLAQADILAYPNTFAETSCIAVMEAMGAGCTICTSRLGALPETCANFGFLLDPPAQHALHAKAFADLVISTTKAARLAPKTLELQLNQQVCYTRTYYTWRARARLWEKALEAINC